MGSLKDHISLILEEQSDDSIYYRLAKNMWAWKFKGGGHGASNVINKYKITKSNPRAGLIRWFKDNYPPIPKASKEVIPRSQWDMNALVGQTENQIMYKAYDEIVKYHLKHPDKRHDILMILECSNKKPYNDDSSKIRWMRMFDNYCDFANADYGLIPYAYCEYYPYRYDEWDHYAEGEYGSWWYRECSKINFKQVMDAWGYKRCVVVMQNAHPRQFLMDIKKNNLFGWGDRMEIVTDDAFYKKMEKKYSGTFGNKGLLITRMMNLPETVVGAMKAVLKWMKDLKYKQEDIDTLSKALRVAEKAKRSGDSIGKALKAADFATAKSYVEWPYGPKEDSKDDNKKDDKEVNENLVLEGRSLTDMASKLSKLEKELDKEDVDKIKEQKIEDDMGDDVDLVNRPDDLFKKYQWAWPCGKLLYWMMNKELKTTLSNDYAALKDFMQHQKNWGVINEYFFYYKPMVEKMGWNEKDVEKAALKIHFIEDHKNILTFDINDYWPK